VIVDETPAVGPALEQIGREDRGDGANFKKGFVRSLYRVGSPHNSIFATDRCNSNCLMCSQPPKDIDDSEMVEEHLRLISLIPPTTQTLGISGGEPTLLAADLFRMIAACKENLPITRIHMLSNGRRFADREYAAGLAQVRHPRRGRRFRPGLVEGRPATRRRGYRGRRSWLASRQAPGDVQAGRPDRFA